MNAPMATRRLSARRDDPLPSLPAPNGLSLGSSGAQRSRFAALAEKKSDGFASLCLGGGGSAVAATPHKVWLGSLPSTLTEVELRERLGCFGTIQSFFFKPEQPGAVAALSTADQQHNKKARGWAFVSYATAEEAQALIRAVDGKSPDVVFPLAGASLAAPGTAPPVEARLANATKSSGSSLSLTSDSRTNYSEDELHSREKLLALAFFSPSHKPSAAGRASSLAPPSAGVSVADPGNNSSSTRCSSHPRVANSSTAVDKPDVVYSGVTHTALLPLSGEQSKPQSAYSSSSPLRGGNAGSPSSSAALPRQSSSKLAAAGPTPEQQKQQLKLLLAEETPPPAATSFPPPPAGSGSFNFPQLPVSDKFPATADTPVKTAEDVTPAAAREEATAAAATAGGASVSAAAPLQQQQEEEEQQQQQQPAVLDGNSGVTAAAAQREKRVYGGLHAAAFPPLSAAAAVNTGGHSARPQQHTRPDGLNLPSLWEVYWTADTHQPYYYNAISKHVQWERPLPPREYVEQYGNPMTAELGPPAPLIPGITRGVVAGKGGAVVGPQGSNLFVFHLPPEWTEQTFLRHFAPFGNVVSCKIQINAQTGKRGGFGFVSYDNPASAIASIRMLNGFGACGKMLKVQLKKGEEHLLPPDLQQQQQQQQQHQQQHQQQQGLHPPPAPPMGFTWSAAP